MKFHYLILTILILYACTPDQPAETNQTSQVITDSSSKEPPFEYRSGHYELLNSLRSKNFGLLRLVRPTYKEGDFDNDTASVTDSVFLFYSHKGKSAKIFLSDINFFYVQGKIQLDTSSSIAHISLDIHYHTALGSGTGNHDVFNDKREILVDLPDQKVLFHCTPQDYYEYYRAPDFPGQKHGIEKYEYKFHWIDNYIVLDSLKGNIKPDKAMGKYILKEDQLVKQK